MSENCAVSNNRLGTNLGRIGHRSVPIHINGFILTRFNCAAHASDHPCNSDEVCQSMLTLATGSRRAIPEDRRTWANLRQPWFPLADRLQSEL